MTNCGDDGFGVIMASGVLFILGVMVFCMGMSMYEDATLDGRKSKAGALTTVITGALFVLPGLVRLVLAAVLS